MFRRRPGGGLGGGRLKVGAVELVYFRSTERLCGQRLPPAAFFYGTLNKMPFMAFYLSQGHRVPMRRAFVISFLINHKSNSAVRRCSAAKILFSSGSIWFVSCADTRNEHLPHLGILSAYTHH